MAELKNKIANVSDSLDVMPIIKRYVAMKRAEKRLQDKIKAAYEGFAKAATALEADGMKVGKAVIELGSTARVWEYSPKIVKAEKELKEAKKKFQETHEPIGGGEPQWKVKTNV